MHPGAVDQAVQRLVINKVRESAGVTVDAGDPLMDRGLDSLAATELRNSLQRELGSSVKLPSTLTFDYPTVAAVTQLITGQLMSGDVEASQPTRAATEITMSAASCPDANVFQAARYGTKVTELRITATIRGSQLVTPGGSGEAGSLAVLAAHSSVQRIPAERFEIQAAVAAVPDLLYVQHGHFVSEAEMFDHAFFAISAAEVRATDPSHRLLLETVFTACVASGQNKKLLLNSSTGMLLGICNVIDWSILQQQRNMKPGVFSAHGADGAAAAGRVSYLLGLKGPCVSVNTACSSSLVALDAACQNLQLRTCERSLVAGVCLQLHSSGFAAFCALHSLAPDGQCKTFDSRADGFGRSEACGAILLETASSVGSVEVEGNCVNQDGRSASFMAPNGLSQEAVMQGAMSTSVCSQADVLEAHGTGTALGDPIEVGAMSRGMSGTLSEQPVVVGAIKSLMAHSEGAAGMAGLVKLLKVMRSKMIPPNLQLEQVNPKIELDGFEVALPSQVCTETGMGCGGVSSFGHSGTNAHAVVSSAICLLGAYTCATVLYKPTRFLWVEYPSTCKASPLLGPDMSEGALDLYTWENCFNSFITEFLADHAVGSVSLVPGTYYLRAASCAASCVFGSEFVELQDANFEAFNFLDSTVMVPQVRWSIHSKRNLITLESWGISFETWESSFAITHKPCPGKQETRLTDIVTLMHSCNEMYTDRETLYSLVGNDYRGEFRAVSEAWFSDHEVLAKCRYSAATEDSTLVELRACAVLDGSTHPTVITVGGIYQPFYFSGLQTSVQCAHGFEQNNCFWSVLSGGDLQLYASDMRRVSLLQGGEPGFFEPRFLEADRARQRIYTTMWQASPAQLKVSASTLSEKSVISVDTSGCHSLATTTSLVMDAVQTASSSGSDEPVWLITHMAVGPPCSKWQHGCLLGLTRSINLEYSSHHCHLVDIDVPWEGATLQVPKPVPEVSVLRQGTCYVPKLQRFGRSALTCLANAELACHGSYLISGGTGALGRWTAGWMAGSGARHILLLSRSGGSQRQAESTFHEFACDVSVQSSVASIFSRKHFMDDGLDGVIHAAGVAQTCSLGDVSRSQAISVLSPKLGGAHELECETAMDSLSCFVVFSSTSALFGVRSGGLYAGSNSSLDSFATHRRAAGLSALSIEWGAWSNMGMAAHIGEAETTGFVAGGVTTTIAAWALQATMGHHHTSVAVADIRWRRFLSIYDTIPTYLSEFSTREVCRLETPKLSRGDVEQIVLASALDAAGLQLKIDDHMVESGLDSLAAVELRDTLQRKLGTQVKLESSMFFKYHTGTQVTEYILGLLDGAGDSDPVALRSLQTTNPASISISAMACRLAGNTRSVAHLWVSLTCQQDHIRQSPPSRWTKACTAVKAPIEVEKMAGAFMDATLPSTPRDQHLDMLMVVAQEAADTALAKLDRSSCGVFSAAQTSDFEVHVATYIVARAVALELKTDGPYTNVEAVCSSGYIAVCDAAQQINDGICNAAIVAGVSLMLRPDWAVLILNSNIMSRSGSMRPLDTSADGMVWGEGASAVVLQAGLGASLAVSTLVGW